MCNGLTSYVRAQYFAKTWAQAIERQGDLFWHGARITYGFNSSLSTTQAEGTRMKSASALVMIVVAVFLVAPPASALVYDYYLTNWNVIELNTAGDKIHAQIDATQVTFTRVDGNSLDPVASNLESNWYTLDIHTNSASGLAARYTTTDPCAAVIGGKPNGLCTADGFGVQIWQDHPADSDTSAGSRQTVVLNSATDLPRGLDTAAHSFALHIQYGENCSGSVDGSAAPTSNSACTPAPEPITMFLGGTGLLALGYAGRKRLFSRLAS